METEKDTALSDKKIITKIINHAKWGPIHNAIYNSRYSGRIITIKGRQILLENNPKTGKCSKCNKRIGDHYINKLGNTAIIKRTSIHHLNYDHNDPLKHTVELCNHCHTVNHQMWKKTKSWSVSVANRQ